MSHNCDLNVTAFRQFEKALVRNCGAMTPFSLQNDSEIPPNLRASYGDKGQNLLGALGVDVQEESEEGVRRKKKKKKKVSR